MGGCRIILLLGDSTGDPSAGVTARGVGALTINSLDIWTWLGKMATAGTCCCGVGTTAAIGAGFVRV